MVLFDWNSVIQDKYPHDPGGRDIYKYQVKEYKIYMKI